ncbi:MULTISPECIES: porin family protein [Dyadobacter]|jgi:outer membrane protein W|uniref:Porin family protein n=1 Tax=Dyadobacter chenhuakuii TaxID=2909339 RepID=A0A9X1TTJ3_9BACT|nr:MULTISPECIES: porin family protein [Dyadobacter]MCF2494974.1 porin family protein [Dyadobacter chenhuakuii]MCF2498052.1 porin family protein [Dyadobacter chenhuakuii]MCF2518947.1 porin family protein [Dyadobacter sp. CY351]USJ31711.1 porin family protein [Dyadobacter chenhuakuii]
MKNCIILLLAVTLFVTQAQAQENVSIGPIVGVSIANFRGDVANTDWKPGITVGGFYNYSSESGFGFSGQLLFTQMGAQNNNKTNELNLNYIQAPLLATFFFGQYGDKVRPKIFLGPSLNFLVGARDKDGNNLNGDSNNRVYSPFDLGLTFGAGINIRLQEKIWLNLDARYGLGLIDVTKDGNTNVKNQNFGINAGLSFPLGTYNSNTGRLRTR